MGDRLLKLKLCNRNIVRTERSRLKDQHRPTQQQQQT